MNVVAPGFESKIVSADQLHVRARQLARPLVFTNGVFDILHRGHVTYLAQARALGAALVVAVNSDASVRMLGKGDDRPLNREEDRAALLAALQSVDLVTVFSEREPLRAIEAVRPRFTSRVGTTRCRRSRKAGSCERGAGSVLRSRSSMSGRRRHYSSESAAENHRGNDYESLWTKLSLLILTPRWRPSCPLPTFRGT